MKSRFLPLVLTAFALAAAAPAAENFDAALQKAATDYAGRLKSAAEELNRTRERIATEKAPLLKDLRATEDRIIALERETLRLSTDQENSGATKRRLLKDIEEQRKTGAYITTLATDALKALHDGLPPGEEMLAGEQLGALQAKLEAATTAGNGGPAAVEAAEFLFARTERLLGGSLVAARALNASDNTQHEGTLAFAGPEVFFAPAGGGPAGIVRMREGSRQPAFYPQAAWTGASSIAFFSGKLGTMTADPTGGKALRLQQTGGTLFEHVDKGGKVAYAIVVVGVLSLLLMVHKLFDVAAMRVDTTARVGAFLRAVAAGARPDAEGALAGISRTSREVFAEGLRHLDAPAAILEEKLEAVLLGQRLHFERRLPLLAVIATAAPLMGLLGTVVGMVKTFTLITVFGTGNAGKLSGGISEVLVATELGLAVAIPTLVAHGFLAHRINKNLAVLERQALEFATAAGTAQSGLAPAKEVR